MYRISAIALHIIVRFLDRPRYHALVRCLSVVLYPPRRCAKETVEYTIAGLHSPMFGWAGTEQHAVALLIPHLCPIRPGPPLPGVCFSQVTSKDGKPSVEVTVANSEKKIFSPEEISAMLLTKMKETAEVFHKCTALRLDKRDMVSQVHRHMCTLGKCPMFFELNLRGYLAAGRCKRLKEKSVLPALSCRVARTTTTIPAPMPPADPPTFALISIVAPQGRQTINRSCL